MSLSSSSLPSSGNSDQSALQSLISSSQTAMDRVYPAQKRANLQPEIKAYTLRNPKLSAFILINILLTGPPILLFTLYSLAILLFSFSAVLITTFVLASLFTASMMGIALLVLMPTVLVTTSTAVVLFAWGLVAYWVFEWASKKSSSSSSSTTTTMTTERIGQPQKPQQVVDHEQEQQDRRHHRLQAEKQQAKHVNTFAHDEKGSWWSGFDQRAKNDKDDGNGDEKPKTNMSEDSGELDSGNMPYEAKKEAAAATAASDQSSTPVDKGSSDRTLEQPVHPPDLAKQADYKACIAENGAYIEIAPGLETVHSIALHGG